MGVQSIDDETCKVYILSNDGHYKGAGNMYSGGLVVRMLDFKKQDDNWTMTKMWEPRGGAMYEGSIRETIPSELADLIFSDEETEIKRRSPMKRKRRSRRTIILTKWRNINFV